MAASGVRCPLVVRVMVISVPDNLPSNLTGFIPRRAPQAEILRLLSNPDARLATLTGT